MRETEYAFAVANIRANENKLLSHSDISAMLGAKSAQDIMAFLSDKGWSDEPYAANDFERLLFKREQDMFNYVSKLSPCKQTFNLLLYKNDFHNLKVILKSIVADRDYSNLVLQPSIVSPKLIAQAILDKQFTNLPEFISDTAKKAYDILTQTLDGQLCDIYIDKAALIQMQQAAKNTKNEYIIELYERIVASACLKTAIRAALTQKSYDFILSSICDCKYFSTIKLAQAAISSVDDVLEYVTQTEFAPCAELVKQSVSAFEKWCDDFIMAHIKTAKYKPFGVEPLVAYLYACEYEIKAVRIIISGKINSLDDNRIMERVRELYV